MYTLVSIFFLFFSFLLTFNVKNKENVATEKDGTQMQNTLQCFDIYRCLCQNIVVFFVSVSRLLLVSIISLFFIISGSCSELQVLYCQKSFAFFLNI